MGRHGFWERCSGREAGHPSNERDAIQIATFSFCAKQSEDVAYSARGRAVKIPFSVYDFFAYLATGFVVLVAVDFALDLGWTAKEKLPPGMVVFVTIGAYVLGHIVANLSSYFLEHQFLRGVLRSPEETLFGAERRTPWRRLFPIFYKPFPEETQRRILEKAKAAGIEKPGRGLFFHCHALVKRDQATLERLNTFLNLYGFCRNVCAASLIAAAILLFAAFAYPDRASHTQKLAWAIVAVGASIGLFYRYLKFFKHYTEEVYRSYAEL